MASLNLKILNGEDTSDIMAISPSVYLASVFVDADLKGTTLSFYGDLGDGVMRLLNFAFDLTSTDPVLRGQVVTDMQSKFAGLTRIQVKSDQAQIQDVIIIFGYAQ